ncbi:MAG: TIGR02186 family protein, partial [Devosia sp.]|nr:TIGR02186 family protein [Devosia sp.]
MRRYLLAVMFGAMALPVAAEQLVTQVSSEEVAITSSFAGQTLTLFGTIAPEAGSEQKYVEGPFHIVVTVTGPLQKRVARKMSNQFGIWINTEQAVYEEFPSFYQVLSDAKLDTITHPVTLAETAIPLDSPSIGKTSAPYPQSQLFRGELVKLMQRKGHYG